MKKQATFHNAFRLVLLAGVISLILGPLSGCKKINNILFEYMPQDIGESDLKGWASGCWGDVKILKKGDLMEEDPDMKKLAEAFDDAAAELGAEKTIKSRGDICRQQTVVYQCKHNAADSDYDKETEQDFYRCKDKYGEWGLWSVEPIPVKEFPQEPIKSTDIQGWPTGCWGDVRIEKSGAMRVNPETKCQKTNIEYICKYHPKNNSEWNIKAPFYRCQDDTGKWGLWNEEAKFVASWPEPITHPTEDEMRGWLTGCYDDFVLKDYGRMQYVNRAYPKWNSQQISVLKESMSKFASKSDVDKMIEDTLEKTKTIRHFVMSNYGDKCVMLDANYFCGKEQEANSEQTKNKFVKCKNDKNQWGVWKKITKGESDIGYLEKQPTVDLTILTDARCTNCVVDTIINQMKKIFPSLVEKKLDYGTEDGKKLYESLKTTEARLLPAFLFDKNVTEDPGYQQVAKWML
ncbi:MAG TPA: hypothetical protein P5077_11140, partial [bacterium]|nr:hypothetical protein [bacterium]